MPEEETKDVKETNWFQAIPLNIKIIGIVLIGIYLYNIRLKGGNVQTLIFWGGLVLLIWYLVGRQKQETVGIITPRIARKMVKDELQYMLDNGDLPQFTRWEVGPNCDIQYTDVAPDFYLIAVTLKYPDGGIEYKQAKVDCFKGLPRIQTSIGKVKGTEAIAKRYILDMILKKSKEHGLEKWFLR